jgi:hypothetical protein
MQEPVVNTLDFGGVGTGAAGDGLDALALGIPEQAHRVGGKGGASALVAQHLADSREVPFQSLNSRVVEELRHSNVSSRRARRC